MLLAFIYVCAVDSSLLLPSDIVSSHAVRHSPASSCLQSLRPHNDLTQDEHAKELFFVSRTEHLILCLGEERKALERLGPSNGTGEMSKFVREKPFRYSRPGASVERAVLALTLLSSR
jgi:hypothetical protein